MKRSIILGSILGIVLGGVAMVGFGCANGPLDAPTDTGATIAEPLSDTDGADEAVAIDARAHRPLRPGSGPRGSSSPAQS